MTPTVGWCFLVLFVCSTAGWLYDHARYKLQRQFSLAVVARALRALQVAGVPRRKAINKVAPELAAALKDRLVRDLLDEVRPS